VQEECDITSLGLVVYSILKGHTAPIFTVKQSKRNCFTLKMKALQSFEMLGSTHPVTQHHYVPENLDVYRTAI
jgi:hypothetical protein